MSNPPFRTLALAAALALASVAAKAQDQAPPPDGGATRPLAPAAAKPTASAIMPRARPKLTRTAAEELLRGGGVTDGFGILGVRGYYLNSMGKWGENDRGIYDDAIVIVTPKHFETFNGNTDPSDYQSGIATLNTGTYQYQIGIHGLTTKPVEKQYKALIQAAPVTVTRDGATSGQQGWFGINIHRGSFKATSSLGCQTIFPEQWAKFFQTVNEQLELAHRKRIPYVLLAGGGAEDVELGAMPGN